MNDQFQVLWDHAEERATQSLPIPDHLTDCASTTLFCDQCPVATVAMANKTARIVWAVLTRNEPYSEAAVRHLTDLPAAAMGRPWRSDERTCRGRSNGGRELSVKCRGGLMSAIDPAKAVGVYTLAHIKM